MWKYTNENRADYGLPPLKYRYDLQKYADIRAKEVFTKRGHTRPDGRSWETVFTDGGLELLGSMGENCAYYEDNAYEIIKNLMLSPAGHKDNILDPDRTGYVVGVYWGEGPTGERVMYTVHFYMTDELG